jgi:hypothetical protein
VDNGSLVVGYGDGVKKTSASKLDVNGDVNITGYITGNDTRITGANGVKLTATNQCVLINNDRGGDPRDPNNQKDVHFNWSSYTSNVYIDNGSLLVGYGDGYSQTSASRLDVNGDVNVNGNIRCTGSVQQSDYRLKSDVVDLSEQPEMTTMNLRPTSYTMDNKPCLGFIAHEVQEYFPQLVTGTKDGENYQTLNYVGLIAVLVNDIQKQQKQIESMKQDIDALQKQLTNKNE